ncbi:hypothetical protein DL765_002745 [Monosporascus sp. GIB2]|nr:hypothetical protein DL765_002745 [Monosporascus sp. GIB2]
MPFIRDSSSPSPVGTETKSERSAPFDLGQQIVDDETYASLMLPGSNEKPLSEQLEPIAVVGMGCRLPGDVKSASDFWNLMMSKGTGQTPKVPESRFNIDAHFHENNDRPGSFSVLGGYFLNETLQEFDPSFFGVTPIEAMWMDPQQRKLLEVVYESFESAGVTLDELAGSKTAVFAASFTADFQQMCFKEPAFRHSLAATGVDPGIISNRISHVFNLRGPSMLVNTACSSSVYALHNACNSLRNKECVAAVVAGVNLVLTVDQHMNTAKLGVLSPTSTCHTFDASADGYGRAEGVGSVYLKRLSDAVRDGDPIRAVIRSSATNNNGKVPAVGITHPNREGQVEVISHAYQRGGDLDPRLTGYFECHGTGTAVGDPLEVHAVSLAMNQRRLPGEEPLIVGAVKTSIGHSEAASGLSALIKGVLAVERGIIPPTRGVVNPSPAIKWEEWKVTVPGDSSPFPDVPVKRVSINSFGYGGTNAHIIVESANSLLTQKQTYKYLTPSSTSPKAPRATFERNRPFLLMFSAHDKPALQRNFAAHGAAAKSYNLLDLAYTLGNRRTAFPTRGFTVVKHADLKNGDLDGLIISASKKTPTVGFVFTGQGAQWARMGAELMAYYPSFLRTIRILDNTLGELEHAPDWTLEDILLASADESPVNKAEFAQPLTTAVQIALVQLLRAWGINPAVTVGHSSGEIAAAYAAGHVSASEAIALAYYRGYVVKDINTDGSMLAVGLGAEAVEPYLSSCEGKVIIACHNSPAGVTLSGDAPAISKLQATLTEDKIFAREVKTGGKAYHSAHMAPAAAKYEDLVQRSRENALPFDLPLTTDARMVSSVTNSVVPKDTMLDAAYFSTNLRQPVLFNQAIRTIIMSDEFANVDMLIEIGPHSAMGGPIRQIKTALGVSSLEYLPTLVRGEDSASQMLKLAGELFLRNYPLDIDRITSMEESLDTGKVTLKRGNLIVDLPPYQWGKKSYWAEARHSAEHRHPNYPRHDLLGSMIPGASLSEPTWRNFLRIRDVPWLKDHSLGGEAVFPAAVAMEATTQVMELMDRGIQVTNYLFRDVSIKKALVTPEDDIGIEVIFNLRPSVDSDGKSESTWWDFNVSSIDQNGILNDHMIGSITVNGRAERPAPRPPVHLNQRASGKEWNSALRAVGFDYGPTFADMTDIEFNGRDYICTCKTKVKTRTGNMVGESRHILHPATVDSCLQLMIASIYAGRSKAMAAAIAPIQVDEICIWKPTDTQLGDGRATAWTDERGVRSFVCGNQLLSNDGQVLMEIHNMRGTLYEAAVPQSATADGKQMPYGQMAWKLDADCLASAVSVEEFVELAAFKNPTIKVLDIGGAHAAALLEKISELDYTGIMRESESTERDLDAFKNAKWQVVDFEKSLSDQGLEDGSFDVVIADMDASDIRKLISKGGKLVIPKGDFSAEIVSMYAPENKPAPERLQPVTDIQLVYRQLDQAILSEIQCSFSSRGLKLKPIALCDMQSVQPNVVILDFRDPMLVDLTEREFKAIQSISSQAKTLVWATAGGLFNGKIPEAGMTAGLVRSIRAEQATINIVTMDFDLENTPVGKIAELIADKSSEQMEDAASVEPEYCISDSKVYISRLMPNEALNDQDLQEVAFVPEMRVVGKVDSGKVVFEQCRPSAELAPDAVEVKVSLAGLNKETVLAINGSDISTTLSHEVGGVVERVGNAVRRIAVGDRVVGFGFGEFGSYQVTTEGLVQKLHPSESVQDMVGLPLPYASALYGLKTLAGVQCGENVLILEGTGLAGAAAIEIAKVLGAIPLVMASGEQQVASVMQQYGLPRKQVLASPNELLSVLHRSNGRSETDVIFGSGSTPDATIREAWRSIAPFGRFIHCGKKKVLKRGSRDLVPFHRGANYYSFDVLELHRLKPAVMAQLLGETIRFYREHKISIIEPVHVQNIAEIDDAVANFSDNFGAGKTVISYEKSGSHIRMIPSLATTELSADATYLLVGCLGGIGRSLTSWMMQKGARHFSFLSRSGADAPEAALLVKDLEAASANVQIVRGDVSLRKDVERAVAGIPAERPLRGVIQAAMVLRDTLFQNMTFQDWQTSTKPKVRGTANLQAVLAETPLDFFLMTSSVSSILGTPGQANYAAGNEFLNALAHHRRVNGKNACAAIIPMVLGVGIVAENTELEEALMRKGMYGIDEEHLLRSLDIAIKEQQPGSNSGRAPLDHLVIGLDPAELARTASEAGDVDAFWMADKRFQALVYNMKGSGAAGSAGGATSVLASMQAAAAPEEALQLARDHVVGKLARMLLLDLEVFEGDSGSIASYGIDSMIGAELRNWLFKEFAMDVPFQQLLGPALTPLKLAQQVCAKHGLWSG